MCYVESFLRGSSLWIGAPFQFLLSLLLFVCPIIADILFGGIFCEALFFEFPFPKSILIFPLSFGGGISALFCWQSELGISVLAAAASSSVNGEWQRRRGRAAYFTLPPVAGHSRTELKYKTPQCGQSLSESLVEYCRSWDLMLQLQTRERLSIFGVIPTRCTKGLGTCPRHKSVSFSSVCPSLLSSLLSSVLRSPSRDYPRPSESTLEKALSTNSSASPILKRRQRRSGRSRSRGSLRAILHNRAGGCVLSTRPQSSP